MLLLLLLPPSFCLGVMDAADDHGSSVKIQDPVSFSCQPPVNLLHFGGSHQALCIQKSHRGVPIKKASASLGHPNPRGFQVVFLDGRAAQVLCHYLIDYKQCWLLPCFVLPSQFSLPARNNQRKGHCSDSNDIELDFEAAKSTRREETPTAPVAVTCLASALKALLGRGTAGCLRGEQVEGSNMTHIRHRPARLRVGTVAFFYLLVVFSLWCHATCACG